MIGSVENEERGLLGIGAFAKLVGLAPSALRFYDDVGLLAPAQVDRSTGYRLYGYEQQGRAVLIRQLREVGLPLAEVRHVLASPPGEARQLIGQFVDRLAAQLVATRSLLPAIFASLGKEETSMSCTVELSGPEFARAIRQVSPAAADVTGERPMLAGVLAELGPDTARFAASDSYRLAIRDLSPTRFEGEPARLVVSRPELEAARVVARHAEAIVLEVADDTVVMRAGPESRVLATIPEVYPDIQELLEGLDPHEGRVIVDRAELFDTLSALPADHHLALVVEADQLRVTPVGDEPLAPIPASVSGMVPQIGFTVSVLSGAVEASVGPDLLLELTTPSQPVVVRSADQGSFTTLVMPVVLETDNDVAAPA